MARQSSGATCAAILGLLTVAFIGAAGPAMSQDLIEYASRRKLNRQADCPPVVQIIGVRTDRAIYWDGNVALVTVTLSADAPKGGFDVALEAWFADTPSEVWPLGESYYSTVPMGSRILTIPAALWYSGDGSQAGERMVIRARSVRTWKFPTCSITVCPAPSVRAVTFSPNEVRSGALASGTVTLCSPAPAPGASVMIGCGTGAVTVTVPPGRTEAAFTLRSPTVGLPTLLQALSRIEVAPGVWAGWPSCWANALTVTP